MDVTFRAELFLEVLQGLDRIRWTGTGQFYIRGLKTGLSPDGQADHFKTILSIGHLTDCLVRGVGRRDQQQLVQVESLPDFYRSPKMTKVDWIEGTAKKA
jgi:hypothetical protein